MMPPMSAANSWWPTAGPLSASACHFPTTRSPARRAPEIGNPVLESRKSEGHDEDATAQQRLAQVIELLCEILGAVMILIAFALAQFRGLDRHGSPYLALNLMGSAILAIVAVVHRQWGFLLLQGV